MKNKIIITILSIITILILLNYFKNISQINKNIIKNDIKEEVSEDYIIGVVACQMPALYHEEALKAQAIAVIVTLPMEIAIPPIPVIKITETVKRFALSSKLTF